MLLANCVLYEEGKYGMDLCLIPHRHSEINPPVKIDLLDQTDGAVCSIGQGEGVSVKINAQERSKVIEALRPAVIYITPTTSDMPGVKVNKLKIVYLDNKRYEIFYTKDSSENWMKFNANDPRGSLG